jgi:hypothetical protein
VATSGDPDELPGEIRQALAERGVSATDEVSLRVALEQRLPAYTVYRLPPHDVGSADTV